MAAGFPETRGGEKLQLFDWMLRVGQEAGRKPRQSAAYISASSA